MLQPIAVNKPLSIDEKLQWLRLSRAENVGPITFYRLIERFGSCENALKEIPNLAHKGGAKRTIKIPERSEIEKEYEHLQKIGGDIITARCPDYPLSLSATEDAPPILSYMGNISLANKPAIAIVGARNASVNGKKFAQRISYDLAAQGQCVVSGLARGIDTAAHVGALSAVGGASTIAVVAGGIDVIYPPENTALYEEIKEKGLILAESALSTEPKAHLFPRRNRIVAGLAAATIVMEANLKSGSLITARLAGEIGRDVMAVPGHPLDPRAQGPNHLIREGATLIRGADDILEMVKNFSGTSFRDTYTKPQSFIGQALEVDYQGENAQEEVLNALSFTPISVDELVRNCQLSIPALQMILLELELAGRIERLPGGKIGLLEQV